MSKKNLILRYFGIAFLLIGIALNLKMYFNQEWPTIVFFIVCFIGLVQIVLSFILRTMKVGWQIFWSLVPFVFGFIYLRILLP
jgi:hypothetical protein